jgi:hypothetical protein
MKSFLLDISDVLARVKWSEEGQSSSFKGGLLIVSRDDYRHRPPTAAKTPDPRHVKIGEQFLQLLDDGTAKAHIKWPLCDDLKKMIRKQDGKDRIVGAHVVAVLASLNALLPGSFSKDFFVSSAKSDDEKRYNEKVYWRAREAHDVCWGENLRRSPLASHASGPGDRGLFCANDEQRGNAMAFLRVCALYHDMGKTLSTEHHVPRGVHIMRDTSNERRQEVEQLFATASEKNRFWAILGHHDVFGVLATGEASLPALADMIGWTSDTETDVASGRSNLTEIAMFSWHNIADSNAAMMARLGGLTTSEAHRYLEDWWDVHDFLARDTGRPWAPIGRDTFKRWALDVGSRPDKTIQRIARLIATCHQYGQTKLPGEHSSVEKQIQGWVEQELQAIHGPRFEHFCYRFARFCKLDYGLSFVSALMKETLAESPEMVADGVRRTVSRTCAILHRIVDEYGHLVEGDPRTAPRLGVDMSKLTIPQEQDTTENICRAMRENEARAMRWIIDEVSIWLYGD